MRVSIGLPGVKLLPKSCVDQIVRALREYVGIDQLIEIEGDNRDAPGEPRIYAPISGHPRFVNNQTNRTVVVAWPEEAGGDRVLRPRTIFETDAHIAEFVGLFRIFFPLKSGDVPDDESLIIDVTVAGDATLRLGGR